MIRNAFTMKLMKGFEAEYKRRHDEIWPELSKLLSESGISEYSIFLDHNTSTLFAFQKVHQDYQIDSLPNHPLVKKWWAYMSDIMETNPDKSPVENGLVEVFHLP